MPEETTNLSMEQSTQAIQANQFFDFDWFKSGDTVVQYFIENKIMPKGIETKGQLMLIWLRSKELGIGFMQAISGMYIINGVIQCYGSLVTMLIRKHGYKIERKDCSSKSATLTLTSPDGSTNTETCTFEEYKAKGVVEKGFVRKSQPDVMLRYKCMAKQCKFFCPEVLGGLYIEGEMEDSNIKTEPVNIMQSLNQNSVGAGVELPPAQPLILGDVQNAVIAVDPAQEGGDATIETIIGEMQETQQATQPEKPKTAMDPTDKQMNTINELLDIADEIDKPNMQKYLELSLKATNRLTASGAIKQMATSLKAIPGSDKYQILGLL